MGQAGHAGRPGQEEVEARRGDADTSRIRDETLAECNRLLTDATRVVHEARVVAEGIKSEMLAEVEEEARRAALADIDQERDAARGEAAQERTALLRDAEREAGRVLEEATRQIAAREASLRAEIERERDAIVAGARAEAARARDELD